MYNVLSPDGFPIEMDAMYPTKKSAREALRRFIDRYRTQGFYRTGNGERIPVRDIARECSLVDA